VWIPCVEGKECVDTVHKGDDDDDDDDDDDNNNNNGTSVLSIQFNSKIRFTQSYDTRHVTSYCSAVKHWLLLHDWPTTKITEIVSDLPL